MVTSFELEPLSPEGAGSANTQAQRPIKSRVPAIAFCATHIQRSWAVMSESRTRTTILINLASILEKCDEQILPAVYAWVGASFDATPTQLGTITLGRAMMQALSSPLGGVAGHFMPRGTVIAIGCWLWAAMTSLFALTTSLYVAMPICAINGVGLALVIPNVQSLTADYYHASSRGQAFGTLWLTISIGGMLGALYATNTAAHTPFGIEGWRFVFLSVAVVSALAGLLNYLFVHDPTFKPRHKQLPPPQQGRPGRQGQQGQEALSRSDEKLENGGLLGPEDNSSGNLGSNLGGNLGSGSGGGGGSLGGSGQLGGGSGGSEEKLGATLRRLAGEVGQVMKIPTFGIIIVQGIVGSVPYASLIFLTLYFQLMGMSNFDASLLVALYLAGGGVGGLLGGFIGDRAAGRFPDHGRIVATQFSVIIGVPFAFLLFKGLPMDGEPSTVWMYRGVITTFAVLTAWPAPCCNNPAFAEIVPPAQRNLIYAFDRCFEGAMAACSAPLVGLLAQRWFGFSGASTVTGNVELDVKNARAMGSALLAFTTIPWTFCFFMYSGLHMTYPKDRRRALERVRSSGQHEFHYDANAASAERTEEVVPLRVSERQRQSPTRRGSSTGWLSDPWVAQQLQGQEQAGAQQGGADLAAGMQRSSSERMVYGTRRP